MSKKVLPLAEPLISSTPGYANTLSILMQHEAGRHWVAQKYFHVIGVYRPSDNSFGADFITLDKIKFANYFYYAPDNIRCPGIKSFSIPRKYILDSKIDIIEFIKYFIDQKQYVNLQIDRSKISEFKTQKSEYSTHQTFIAGYNDTNNTVLMYDFFDGSAYKSIECDYDVFRRAFIEVGKGRLYKNGVLDDFNSSEKINVLCYDDEFKYTFSFSTFIDDINYYLKKKSYVLNYIPMICDTSEDKLGEDRVCFGIDFYDIMQSALTNAIKREKYIIYNLSAFFWDQKRSLNYTLDYLFSNHLLTNEEIREKGNELLNIANMIIGLTVKHNFVLRNDENMAQRITDYLAKAKEIEIELLSEICTEAEGDI